MTVTSDGSITGTAQTGLTSPTYTTVVDTAPDVNGKQWVVSALGGTQTDVRAHAVSDPFTITVTKPKVPKRLPDANPVTGKYPNVPHNTYGAIIRKGVKIASSGQLGQMTLRLSVDVPAGADAADAVNLRAAMSFFIGFLNENSAGFGDTLANGVL